MTTQTQTQTNPGSTETNPGSTETPKWELDEARYSILGELVEKGGEAFTTDICQGITHITKKSVFIGLGVLALNRDVVMNGTLGSTKLQITEEGLQTYQEMGEKLAAYYNELEAELRDARQ